MTSTSPFERRLASTLGQIADGAPTNIDPLAMARAARTGASVRPPMATALRPLTIAWPATWLLLIIALLAAFAGGVLVGGAARLPIAHATASPDSSESPSPVPTWPAAHPLPSTRVGFIGLPPSGAVATAPGTSELVLSYGARPNGIVRTTYNDGVAAPCCPFYKFNLYADGRLVWEVEGDLPFGANASTTGLIEQRLTSDGVELMRSAALSSNLFGRPSTVIRSAFYFWGDASVRVDGQLQEIQWGKNVEGPSFQSQQDSLRRLREEMVDPVGWLPPEAWSRLQPVGYVPNEYGVCSWADSGTAGSLVDQLPVDARAFLASSGTPMAGSPECYRVSTADARELSHILVDSALEPASLDYVLGYVLPSPWNAVSFVPVMPDGALQPLGG